MKSARISLHRDFPCSPVSGWVGACGWGWVNQRTASGQYMRPRHRPHPFLEQRKLWCRLEVHFNGVDLQFALPQELDQFIAVMSQKILPSGRALVSGRAIGRPNSHWLSRLPGRAKPLKFRLALCRYLREAPEIAAFREFYSGEPLRFEFDGFHDSFQDAVTAQAKA